jgi:hypothetical protein
LWTVGVPINLRKSLGAWQQWSLVVEDEPVR